MRMVTGDDGSVKWGRIVLALALTVASGYLASKSQRWGSGEGVPPRARAYHAVQVYAHGQVTRWQRVEGMAKTGYEIAVLK
jgi:hypothetical protein